MRKETDSFRILARWRNHFSQIFNVYVFGEVRQRKMRTPEQLLSEPSAFEFEMVIGKLKRHKLPGIDQLPA